VVDEGLGEPVAEDESAAYTDSMVFCMKASRLLLCPMYGWYSQGMGDPSYSVPTVSRYQSVMSPVPSGFSEGKRMDRVLSRISCISGSSRVTMSQASSAAVWVAPTSLEWSPKVWVTMATPSRTASSTSASECPRGSESTRFSRWSSSSRARFSGEDTKRATNGLPSVDGPISRTWRRSLVSSRWR